jgi:hypothetical protein
VRALAAVHDVLRHAPAGVAVERSSRWLVDGLPLRVESGSAAPWYSPNGPYVLPNVAGMVASALRRAAAVIGGARLAEAARRATEFVLARQHTSTGLWCYGYAGVRRRGRLRPPDVVDALHMTYTVEGLMSAIGEAEQIRSFAAARLGFQFVGRALVERSGHLRERVVLASRDDPDAATLIRAGTVDARPVDDASILLVFPEESRVAGYGALIGALARARNCGLGDEQLLDRLVTRVLVVSGADVSGGFRYLPGDPRTFPRQEAHLFEGLAAYVRVNTP